MTPKMGGRFWKKHFFTQLAVVQLTCLADGGGWREDQHMWDGQGLKDPFFLKLFIDKITS
jgi:hypothetical protein